MTRRLLACAACVTGLLGGPAETGFAWTEPSPLSADGALQAFTVSKDVPGGPDGSLRDVPAGVLLSDRRTREERRVSLADDGSFAAASQPALDWSGRVVAFSSQERLTPMISGPWVYVRDLSCAGAEPIMPGSRASLSADGRRVVFTSDAAIDFDDNNAAEDVYAFDRSAGELGRVSVGPDQREDFPPSGTDGAALSGDGKQVAFSTEGQLTSDDTDARADVYIRDLDTGTLQRISDPTGGTEPSVSFDGRVVAYTQPAASDTDPSTVWILDRGTGARMRLTAPGGWAAQPSLSADGRRVAFVGRPDAERPWDIWTADRPSGAFKPAGLAPGTEISHSFPVLSADGAWVSGAHWRSAARVPSGFPAADLPAVRAWEQPCRPGVSAYQATVMGDAPVAYWRLGESDGREVADLTGGFSGLLGGWPAWGAAGALAGDPDTSLRLDGLVAKSAGEFVRVVDRGRLDFSTRKPFTLEAWIKPRNLNGHTRRVLSAESGNDGGILLGVRADGVVFSRYDAPRWNTLRAPVAANSWQHVTATYDGVTMRLYVDGQEKASWPSTLTMPVRRFHDLLLGSLHGRYKFYAGDLDEVAVYDRALSPARVSAHHAAG